MGAEKVTFICTECRTQSVGFGASTVCGLCEKLGARSLLRYMAKFPECKTEEERQALREEFAAAKHRAQIPFEKGREALKR